MCKGIQFLSCLCVQTGNMVFKQKSLKSKLPRSFPSTLFFLFKYLAFENILELQVTKWWHLSALVFIWFSLIPWNSLLVLNTNFFMTMTKLTLLVWGVLPPRYYCNIILQMQILKSKGPNIVPWGTPNIKKVL